MSIAGKASRALLARYSYVRMKAKRYALDEIAVRQRAADEERSEKADSNRVQRSLTQCCFGDVSTTPIVKGAHAGRIAARAPEVPARRRTNSIRQNEALKA